MRIGIVTLPAPGHINPMTTLARKLEERGHYIVFVGIPSPTHIYPVSHTHIGPSVKSFMEALDVLGATGSSQENSLH